MYDPEVERQRGIYGFGDPPRNDIEPKCRACGKPVVKPATMTGYWAKLKYPAHHECVKLGMAKEAFECQKIDSDCNDCAFFERGERWANSKKDFNGFCKKFEKQTTAHVGFASLHPCFEHRREKEYV